MFRFYSVVCLLFDLLPFSVEFIHVSNFSDRVTSDPVCGGEMPSTDRKMESVLLIRCRLSAGWDFHNSRVGSDDTFEGLHFQR